MSELFSLSSLCACFSATCLSFKHSLLFGCDDKQLIGKQEQLAHEQQFWCWAAQWCRGSRFTSESIKVWFEVVHLLDILHICLIFHEVQILALLDDLKPCSSREVNKQCKQRYLMDSILLSKMDFMSVVKERSQLFQSHTKPAGICCQYVFIVPYSAVKNLLPFAVQWQHKVCQSFSNIFLLNNLAADPFLYTMPCNREKKKQFSILNTHFCRFSLQWQTKTAVLINSINNLVNGSIQNQRI